MLFTFTITAYLRNLNNLKGILEKAAQWQQVGKLQDDAIMNARLALDQFTFARQVRAATNFAKASGEVLTEVKAPVFDDNETSLSDLIKRVAVTIDYLTSLKEEMIRNDLESRMIALPWVPGKGLVAKFYVEVYAHMNFMFHYTTAYSILRHYGLTIGKADYMGEVPLLPLTS